MADEPSQNGNAKPNDPAKPRIEPDKPTPNRDKRREPITIDLKADPPKPPSSEPPKPTTETGAAKSEAPKAAAKPVGADPATTTKPAEATAATSVKAEPSKTDAKAIYGATIGAQQPGSAAGPAKVEPAAPTVVAPGGKVEPPKAAEPKADAAKPRDDKPGAPKTGTAAPKPDAALPKPDAPAPGPAAAPTPPPRHSMVPALLASAVCAAVVAAGVAYAYQVYTGRDETIATLRGQITTLQGRLDAVDKQVASMPQTTAVTAVETGANQKFAAIDQKLGAADAARAQAVEASEQRLRKLETIRNEVTGALEKRVGSLEALTTTLGAQIDQANTKAEVVRIQAARAVEAVAKASATPPGAPIILPPTVDVAPISARLKEVEAQLKAVEATLARPKTETRATEVRAVVPSPKADPANVAIVAQALVRAFDQGAPFAGELATLEALGAGDRAAALKPFAEHGAPKFSELTAQFASLRPAILAAATPPASGGFLDRLSSGAAGLVSVRPTGATAEHGASPAALVGQIETALGHGDTAAALAAWAKLPPPARKVSEAWADTLRARETAHQSALALAATSIAALAKPKS